MKDDLKLVVDHAREDLKAIGPPGRFAPPETTLEDKRSWLGKVMDYVMDRMLPEIGDMVMQKTAQGAAEISHALNSQSNAYTPYGYGQQPLEVEGPQQSFTDMVREASERQAPHREMEMER